MDTHRRIRMWLVLVWMIAGLTATAWASPPDTQEAARPAVGQPAPDFDLTLFNGKTVSLHDYQGKAVLIVFWRSG